MPEAPLTKEPVEPPPPPAECEYVADAVDVDAHVVLFGVLVVPAYALPASGKSPAPARLSPIARW